MGQHLAQIACLREMRAAATVSAVGVIDKTGMTMTSFFASSTNTGSWEEDMLDNDALDYGEMLEADIDDGTPVCVHDFKAVFSNRASGAKQKGECLRDIDLYIPAFSDRRYPKSSSA